MVTHEIIDDSAGLLLEVAVRTMIESALAANDSGAVVPRFVIQQGVAAFALGRNMDHRVVGGRVEFPDQPRRIRALPWKSIVRSCRHRARLLMTIARLGMRRR